MGNVNKTAAVPDKGSPSSTEISSPESTVEHSSDELDNDLDVGQSIVEPVCCSVALEECIFVKLEPHQASK